VSQSVLARSSVSTTPRCPTGQYWNGKWCLSTERVTPQPTQQLKRFQLRQRYELIELQPDRFGHAHALRSSIQRRSKPSAGSILPPRVW
jgi:hypothetical protein